MTSGFRAARQGLLVAALLLSPTAIHAQRWTVIGKTSNGNDVYVDSRSIKHKGALVDATVRLVFATPVKTPKGLWASSRTTATFNCAKNTLAAKENVFYSDVKGARVTERTVNKLPGFGPALKGSLGDVALHWVCTH
jgi:hypothetical protein